jgi:hypothetical protein
MASANLWNWLEDPGGKPEGWSVELILPQRQWRRKKRYLHRKLILSVFKYTLFGKQRHFKIYGGGGGI